MQTAKLKLFSSSPRNLLKEPDDGTVLNHRFGFGALILLESTRPERRVGNDRRVHVGSCGGDAWR